MSDLISRVALLDAMPKNDELLSLDVRRVICDAPAVDVEPVRHGRWIRMDDTYARWKCSECGAIESHSGWEYCHCGAKMDGGKEDA